MLYLMIIYFLVGAKRTGIYYYTEKLAKELERSGEEVKIVTGISKSIEVNIGGDETHMGWDRNSVFSVIKTLRLLGGAKDCLIHIQYSYKLFTKNPIKSHILLLLALLYIGKIKGRKIIITLHGVLVPNNFTNTKYLAIPLKLLLMSYYKLLYFLVYKIILLTDIQRNILEKFYGLRADKMIIIPHGVDECCALNPLHNSIQNDSFVLLFHGFIRATKGIKELIDALQIVISQSYNVKLKIIGSIATETLESVREKKYLNVILDYITKSKLTPYIDLKIKDTFDDDEIMKEVLESDIVLLPYKDNYIETSGVLHKIMDCGKPVIVSNIPRFQGELVPDVDCLMVNPTADEIANAIKRLIEDKELYNRISKNLLEKAQERKWRRIAEMHMELYKQM